MKAFLYAAVAAIALTGAPASARVLQFLVTYNNQGGPNIGNFLFTLDETRDANIILPPNQAIFSNVAVRFFNVPDRGTGSSSTARVNFRTQNGQGGLTINSLGGTAANYQFFNTALVTDTAFSNTGPNPNRRPDYLLGTFAVSTTARNNSPRPFDNYTVRITAVPEPAAWAMMIAGFGVAGLGLRRRGIKAVAA